MRHESRLASTRPKGQASAHGRRAQRRSHVPVHRHPGVDAARQAAARPLRRVLADHQRLLRAAFAAHGGYEVDTQGDSFFVAFSSARDALLAAVEGQLALARTRGRRASRSRCGWACTRARRSHTTAATRASPSIAPPASAPPGTVGRFSSRRRLRRCSRTRRRTSTSSSAISASSGSRTSIDQCVCTRPPPTDCRPRSRRSAPMPTSPRPRRPRSHRRGGGDESWLSPASRRWPASPCWRRVLALRGGSGGGLGAVQPNHVGLIDPQTNEIVAEIPVGIRPGPIAVGGRLDLGGQSRGPDADADRPGNTRCGGDDLPG